MKAGRGTPRHPSRGELPVSFGRRWGAKTLAIVVLTVGAIHLTGPQAAAGGVGATSRRATWVPLSRALAAPWPRIQRRSGSYRDYLTARGRSRYGSAMVGLGLIQTGIRDGRRRFVRSGLRALDADARRRQGWTPTRVFRAWAIATAYNLVRRRLRHWRATRASLRRWATYLKRQPIDHLHRNGFANKQLVEAVAVLEMRRTGLRSHARGATLGNRRRFALQRVLRLINRAIPAMAARHPGFVLSDPTARPPAYHALSYALYARAVRLLARRAAARTRAVLRNLGRTSWLLTAPDGSVAYWGRSLDQRWTMAATAYGLGVTARERGSSSVWDRRYYAVASRALTRMRSYGVGPQGEWIVPSLRQDIRAAAPSLDGYASATEYTGLALVFLNLAVPFLPNKPSRGTIAADRPLASVLGEDNGRLAVVRRGRVWIAVRERASGGVRLDFGPIAVQRLGEDGTWRNVVPARPRLPGTTGPALVSGGVEGAPYGEQIDVRSDRVVVRGGFGVGTRWLRHGVTFTIKPTDCGASISFPAQPGDHFRFSAFFRGSTTPSVEGHTVRGGDQIVQADPPPEAISFESDRASTSDAYLTEARLHIRARESRPVRIALC